MQRDTHPRFRHTTPTVRGPSLRGRPVADFADRFGTRLRSGRPVAARRPA